MVDCRPAEQYNAGHLSTAFHLDSDLVSKLALNMFTFRFLEEKVRVQILYQVMLYCW